MKQRGVVDRTGGEHRVVDAGEGQLTGRRLDEDAAQDVDADGVGGARGETGDGPRVGDVAAGERDRAVVGCHAAFADCHAFCGERLVGRCSDRCRRTAGRGGAAPGGGTRGRSVREREQHCLGLGAALFEHERERTVLRGGPVFDERAGLIQRRDRLIEHVRQRRAGLHVDVLGAAAGNDRVDHDRLAVARRTGLQSQADAGVGGRESGGGRCRTCAALRERRRREADAEEQTAAQQGAKRKGPPPAGVCFHGESDQRGGGGRSLRASSGAVLRAAIRRACAAFAEASQGRASSGRAARRARLCIACSKRPRRRASSTVR